MDECRCQRPHVLPEADFEVRNRNCGPAGSGPLTSSPRQQAVLVALFVSRFRAFSGQVNLGAILSSFAIRFSGPLPPTELATKACQG